MSSTLRTQLGLPSPGQRRSGASEEGFGKAFREGINRLNKLLQAAAAEASAKQHRTLEERRSRLYKAYQRVSKKLEGADSGAGKKETDQVIAAVGSAERESSKLVAEVRSERAHWQRLETDFDDGFLKIGELEDAGRPKASTFLKAVETIREKANERCYGEAIEAYEQLAPKLAEAYDAWQAEEEALRIDYVKKQSRLLKAREAWVAARDQARTGVQTVKASLRKAFQRDPQLPDVMAKAKRFDEALNGLSDDLRKTLDNYLAAPPESHDQIAGLEEEASRLIESFSKKVRDDRLLAAVDEDQNLAPGLEVRKPLLSALEDLQTSIA